MFLGCEGLRKSWQELSLLTGDGAFSYAGPVVWISNNLPVYIRAEAEPDIARFKNILKTLDLHLIY